MFADLSKRHPAALVAKWKAMDTEPRKVNGLWVSVYEANYKNGTFRLLLSDKSASQFV